MTAFLLWLTGGCCSTALAHGQEWEITTLKGLSQITVIVSITPDLQKRGITDDWAKNYIEMRLRMLGLKVVPSEMVSTPADVKKVTDSELLRKLITACLSLEFNGSHDDTDPTTILEVRASLLQTCSVIRLNDWSFLPTWEYTDGWTLGDRKLVDRVRYELQDVMDAFTNDYLKANETGRKEPSNSTRAGKSPDAYGQSTKRRTMSELTGDPDKDFGTGNTTDSAAPTDKDRSN